ncbi:unnamed protein product [Adineta ricciae]|uniref:Sulfotransferase domain-containing protein n=1 Tax=Adineta ricciae TaxID=249248 RepID=A0A814G9C6_ADIRI|nr:unnamed protein product [Adineta ricciae]CAF1036345.1 unnamed protein product [Adineta ricciae]
MSNGTQFSPTKQTELEHFWFDSRIWNDFQYRDGDIVIDTFPKCGTTWMQQIIAQLIFNGVENIQINRISPWLDFRFNKDLFGSDEKLLQELEQQTHRRFIKTHLPFHALVYSLQAKYIFVARDGRDVACSSYNHQINMTVTDSKKPNSVHEVFQNEILGNSNMSFFAHLRSWWNMRHLANILFIHYYQLKTDLPNEIKRIATFLDIDIDPSRWNDILQHCSFDYMQANADRMVDNTMYVGGARTFFCKGTNNQWKGILTDEDSTNYQKRVREELDDEGARWILTGELTE